MDLVLSLKNWYLKLMDFLEQPLPAWKAWLIIGLGIIMEVSLFALLMINIIDPWVVRTFY